MTASGAASSRADSSGAASSGSISSGAASSGATSSGTETPAQQLLAREADWGRAPSAHNTQPWEVTATGPDTLHLGWHADRVLEVGDPTRRDLFLSLGCVTEAIAIVAADLGYAVHVTPGVDRLARSAATLHLRPLGRHAEGAADAVTAQRYSVAELLSRRTARGPYSEPGISPEDLAQIDPLAAPALAAPALIILPAAAVETALRVADRWTFDGPSTGELRDWLRLDRDDPRYRLDGLSDAALGLSRWEAVGLALALRPRLLGLLRRSRLTAALARTATARPLGTVVALTAPEGLSDEALLDLGRHLLRVWLEAGRHGLSAHPLSQLLDCPEAAAQVAAALNKKGPGRGDGPRTAYGVFRLGRPTSPAAQSYRITDAG